MVDLSIALISCVIDYQPWNKIIHGAHEAASHVWGSELSKRGKARQGSRSSSIFESWNGSQVAAYPLLSLGPIIMSLEDEFISSLR